MRFRVNAALSIAIAFALFTNIVSGQLTPRLRSRRNEVPANDAVAAPEEEDFSTTNLPDRLQENVALEAVEGRNADLMEDTAISGPSQRASALYNVLAPFSDPATQKETLLPRTTSTARLAPQIIRLDPTHSSKAFVHGSKLQQHRTSLAEQSVPKGREPEITDLPTSESHTFQLRLRSNREGLEAFLQTLISAIAGFKSNPEAWPSDANEMPRPIHCNDVKARTHSARSCCSNSASVLDIDIENLNDLGNDKELEPSEEAPTRPTAALTREPTRPDSFALKRSRARSQTEQET